MTKRKQALIAFVLFDLLLVAIFAGSLLLRSSPENSRAQLSEIGVALLPDQPQLTAFSLVDHHGLPFTNQNLKEKWTLMFFGFTYCPDVCPLTMNALGLFYQDLVATGFSDSTRVVMVSVDPRRDNVETMAKYVSSYHADFIGLTGREEEISKLASQLYIAYEPPMHSEHANASDAPTDLSDAGLDGVADNYEISHSGYIAIIAPDGSYKGVVRAPHTRQSIKRAYFAVRDI